MTGREKPPENRKNEGNKPQINPKSRNLTGFSRFLSGIKKAETPIKSRDFGMVAEVGFEPTTSGL